MRVIAVLLTLALAALLALPCRADDGFIAKGESVGGYRLHHIEHHPEYLRLHFLVGEQGAIGEPSPRNPQTTVLEIGRFEERSGPWDTGRHRLMPAPDQHPPRDLMVAVMERLQSYDDEGGAPLMADERGEYHTPQGKRPDLVPDSWLLGCLLAGFAWTLLLLRPGAQPWLRKLGRHLDTRPWPYLALLLAAMAVPRLIHLDTTFSADAMTQRLMFGSLDVGDILLHNYEDQRHPQLFYLILHGFLWLGHSETIARLPAVLFSLASATTLFVLARQRLGGAAALAATALLGLSLAFLIRSREVGDLTLFTFLALASSLLLIRAFERPRRSTLVALALVEAAMFYAYYLAVLVAGVHLLAALLHARKPQRRDCFWALGVAWMLALPSLESLLRLVRDDMAARDVARAFPVHMWGERTTLELLADVGELFAPDAPTVVLLGLLALIGVWRLAPRPWRDPLVTISLPLLLVSFTVLGAAVVLVRLKPYYLLFTLPFLLVLVVAGALGPSSRGPSSRPRIHTRLSAMGAGAGVAAVALLMVVQAAAMRRGLKQTLTPSFQPRFGALGSVIREHARRDPPGPSTVIADGNNLHTMLVYYAFEDPLGMYRTCDLDRDGKYGTHCRRGNDEVITLTLLPDLSQGWEERSVARLHQVQQGRESWFVYVGRFPNEPLLRELVSRCELVGKFDKDDSLDLFRCPAR